MLTGILLAGSPASAAEYCVTCAGPAAMYACSVEGAPRDAPIDPRMQLLCIQELAHLGGHESCSVPRSAPQPCPGVVRIVAAPASVPAVAGTPAANLPAASGSGPVPVEAPAQEAVSEPANPAPNSPSTVKPPRTVEEMADRTLEASKKGLKKAGDAVTGTAEKTGETVEKAGSAVGNAAKKTWHCLTSLFSEC